MVAFNVAFCANREVEFGSVSPPSVPFEAIIGSPVGSQYETYTFTVVPYVGVAVLVAGSKPVNVPVPTIVPQP